MKLALLPLDDRPCNYLFPQQLARIAGTELLCPARSLLGHFTQPGAASALIGWVAALPPQVPLIASIDMLAYGGLVASRRGTPSLQSAREHLEVLRTRKSRHGAPVNAFNILMRLAVTMDSDAAINHYLLVQRYARLVDEAEFFDSKFLRQELEEVRAQIPPEVLDEYHRARQRNHQVNLQMVDWLSEGIVDVLLVTQEDCTQFGLHRLEQEELRTRAASLGLDDRFFLHPGADEAAQTLLARWWQSGLTLALHWSDPAQAEQIAAFEDRPYRETLEARMAAIQAEERLSGEADFELFINAPVGSSQKDEPPASREARRTVVKSLADRIRAAHDAGRRIALCDVAFPNGADDLLMQELDLQRLLGALTVFAAWNTAGNTTGTVLAHCAALKTAGAAADMIQSRQFLLERLVDDWCWQTRVRPRVERSARLQGLSPLNMGAEAAPFESQATRELRTYARLLAGRHFGTQWEDFEVRLPWGRTFEIEINGRLAPQH